MGQTTQSTPQSVPVPTSSPEAFTASEEAPNASQLPLETADGAITPLQRPTRFAGDDDDDDVSFYSAFSGEPM